MEKKNIRFIITIFILSLIIAGLNGFIVYDKILNSNEKEENNDNIVEDDSLNQENNFNNTKNYSEKTNELFENLNCITIQVVDDVNGNPVYSQDIAVIVEENKLLDIISKFDTRESYEIGPMGFDYPKRINFI